MTASPVRGMSCRRNLQTRTSSPAAREASLKTVEALLGTSKGLMMAEARLWDRLRSVTLLMSVPLFFTVQLKRPPEILHGPAFAAIWSFGVIAAVTLPLFIVAEGAICWWLLRHPSDMRSRLSWHAGALLFAVVAEAVFVIAR